MINKLLKKLGFKAVASASFHFPMATDEQIKHVETVLAAPKLLLTLQFLTSNAALKEALSLAKSSEEEEVIRKTFDYIQNHINENLQSHQNLLKNEIKQTRS